MCHFVTAVLPGSAPHGELDALARKFGRQFQPLSNRSIDAQIAPGEQYFLTTLGHCDCGTPLGALAKGANRTPDWSAQEQRLLKKGWSKAKVLRALAQKHEDARASEASLAESTTKALTSWLEFIGAVLDSGKTPYLGILLHRYSGSIESRVDLAGRETIRSSELTGELLGHMTEDVLYIFRN